MKIILKEANNIISYFIPYVITYDFPYSNFFDIRINIKKKKDNILIPR